MGVTYYVCFVTSLMVQHKYKKTAWEDPVGGVVIQGAQDLTTIVTGDRQENVNPVHQVRIRQVTMLLEIPQELWRF